MIPILATLLASAAKLANNNLSQLKQNGKSTSKAGELASALAEAKIADSGIAVNGSV